MVANAIKKILTLINALAFQIILNFFSFFQDLTLSVN
jgi:hypothetical protein